MENDSKNKDIYLEYADTVRRFLISYTANFDLAEDLTQETFYQAYKSIHRYNGGCKMSVWLCQIAKHVYFDYLKKEKHSPNTTFDSEDIFLIEDSLVNLEEQLILKESLQKLLFVIQNGNNSYGRVLWLRAYEGMSFREIGEVFGKSENWARVNYYRAKEWIRRKMNENEDKLQCNR